MATLEALRGKLPELSGLDDEHAIEFIRRVYYPDRQPAEIAASLGYKPPPPEVKARNRFAVTNDTVIDFANAAAGGIGAAANFVSPGNRVSKYIDENIVAAGKASQSDATRAEDARYAAEMEAAQGFGDEVGTTLGYVARNPLRSVAQAAGSFVGPGASVKGMQLAARGLGAGAAGITRAGLAGGAMAGGAMAGGDAAGTAYELAIKAGATEEEATAAARQASMIPGAIGAAGGLVGAERVFAGGKGFAGGRMSRALKTGAVEAGQEGIEEGVTQYEGQRAAMPFDPNIDPMKGVGGAATMGAVLGGITGGSLAAMSPGDQLRTEGLQPETGPFTRGSNKVVEAAANVLDNATTALGATPPKPLVGNEIDYTPEPITGNLAIGDAQEIARQNIAKFAARHEPIAQADAQAMVARAEAEGKPMVAVPHPEGGGFTVVPRQWVTAAMANPSPQAGPPPQVQAAINAADDLQLEGEAPRMAKAARTPEQALQSIEAQGTVNRFGKPVLDDWSRLADAPQAGSEPEWIEQARAVAEADQRAARAAAVAAAPVDRAPRTPRAQPAPDAAPQADLVATYVDQRRNDGTPAGRAFAQDFDAGRITRADVQGLIDAARPQSADDRLAAAAAQAPKPQALQPGDLLNPKGEPFKNQRAATTTAQREGGSVIVVDGGWAVRKREADAPATAAAAGPRDADAGRSSRTGVLRDERPADLLVSAERPADEGAEQPAAAVVRAGSAAEPAPALSPDADLPALKKAWSEAAAAGDTERARKINDRIVALKKASVEPREATTATNKSTREAAALSVYQATERPGYESQVALSLDDADFEIEALQSQQERGKLRPDSLARSEFGQRLDAGAITQLNESMKADPAGTLQAIRDSIAAKKGKATPKAAQVESDSTPAPSSTGQAPVKQPAGGFDSAAWVKAREDRIKASREAGNTHLDKVPAYVETMRGKRISYVHDTKVKGKILTVDNNGRVYVEWLDAYSQEKEGAVPMQYGKKTVMQTSLGPTDLKDYFVDTAAAEPTPIKGSKKAAEIKAKRAAKNPAPAAPESAAATTEGAANGDQEEAEKVLSKGADGITSAPVAPFEHAGLKVYPTKVRRDGQLVDRWAVQLPENKGTDKVLGDTLHATVEEAKKSAEYEARRDEDRTKRERAETEAAAERAAKVDANRGKSVLERRADAILDKPTTLPASAGLGTGSRRQAMQKAVDEGRAIVEAKVLDSAAKKRDQDAVADANKAGYILGLSNANLPVVKAALEARDRLKANKYETKPEYRVYSGRRQEGGFFEITKTEYDYAQKLMAEPASQPEPETVAPATAAQSQADPVATHKDPGEPAEPVTPAVVADAIKTAAKNEERTRSEMKAEALRLIDAAIAKAPEKGTKKVTIDVPGDGVFTVVNTVDRLKAFRAEVEKSPGFSDRPTKAPTQSRTNNDGEFFGVQDGSGSTAASARKMLEEGEPANAVELLETAGKPMMFGNSTERPIPYTDGSPVEIAGVPDLFVGRGWSTKKGETSWWSVIHKGSGFAMGGSHSNKNEALAEAKKLLSQADKRVRFEELVASGKSADGKPFKTQDELRAEFMVWAEKYQQAQFDAGDAAQARIAEWNKKAAERFAIWKSIMGEEAGGIPGASAQKQWEPANIKEFLNKADKQGRVAEATKLIEDTTTEGSWDAWVAKTVKEWEKAAQTTELSIGYGVPLDLKKPPHTMTWDEVDVSVRAWTHIPAATARAESALRPWKEAHFEAVKQAVERGWRVPDRVLYDYRGLVRSDLNDEDADIAADAMVTTYQQTKDYGKAVQAYRDWKPGMDLKGFERTQKTRDGFVIEDGDMTVLVNKTKTWDGKDRFQARLKNSTTSSGPNLTEQQAVDWAANLRTDMRKASPAPKPAAAKPAPLYASRPVTNAQAIIDWAASQGFKSTLPAADLHVTVAYSRDAMDGSTVPAGAKSLTVTDGKRTVEPLGDEGAVVLKFGSDDLQARWKQYRDAGASWDYDSYTPHITITYDGKGVNLSKVKPYEGPIELGAEKQEALNEDKAADYKEAGEAPASSGAAADATPKQAEPAPVSSVSGQKNLAYRGSRIASLKAMNDRLRKIAPDDAWADKNIENATDLDALQDQISSALVKAERGPAEVNPLRAELDAMSGAELRAIMERMNLAGARMVQEERIAALLAEDPAEVRAAMQQAEPEKAVEPAPAKKPETEPKAGAAFSRTRGRGISTRDAKAVVATIRSALPNAPDIVLHETVAQAPEGLQDKIREEGAEDDVEAVYWNGEIHAFPKHMESVERALFVIGRHEVRHHGMRTRYGKKLDETLMGMWRGNQALRQATQAIIDGGRARPSERLLAIEEALADLPVAEIAKLKGFDRFVAAMRDWLRMTAKRLRAGGFGLLADAIEPKTWTDADVAAFVLKAEQVSGKGGTGTAFSRIAAMKADIDRAWRDLSGFSKFSDFDTEAATKVAGSMDDFVLSREDGKRWAALNVREFKRDDGQTVYSASLEVGSEGFQKGTGAATTMYLQALNVAQRRGMGWQSEGVRSDNAMAIYRRLTEGGVPFKDADGSAYVSAKDLAGVDLMAVARAIAGDRPLPQFSRRPDTMAPAVTIDRDADTGAPVYATDDITIGFPQKTERFEYLGGQNLINYSIGPADGFDSYGMVELEIGPDGVPIGLADIEIKPEYRGRDIGAKVVEAILAAHPGLDLDISNIVEGARGFWSRLGIPEQNRASGEAYDGALNWQTFSQAQNARRADRAGARGRAAGEGRNAQAEGGAPGAGGQAPGQAQGGVARFSRATGMAEPWADKALSAADTVAGLISKPESIVGQTKREYTPEQSAAMKQVGFQVEPQKPSERIKALMQDAGKKIAQGVFDQFAPVKELSEKAYMLLRLSKGASGAFEALLKGGKLKITDGVYDFDEKNRGGVIKQLLTPLQGEHHDFLRWVAANRAERLAGDGKENLFTPESIAALKSLSDGVTSFDYTIQTGDGKGTVTRDRTLIYADAQRIFNGFQRNVMDMAEQSGLIDGEMRQMWEHEFYVPFYRVEDDGSVAGANIKNGVIRQQAFKALTGRSNKLNADLLDNTLMNWAHLLDAAAKNRAAKASIEAAENAKVALPIEGNMGKGSVWFMEDGQKRWSFVDDPYLMTAISALQYGGLKGPAMQALSSLKHMLTIGVTASPFFKVRNLIRDSVQVIASSPIGVNPVANVVQGWKNTGPESDQYFRLLAGGGTIHFGTMMEGSEAKRVQALVESGVDASNILDSDKKVKAFYRKFIEPGITAYNELGNRGEAVNRAALYSQLIDQGVSHAEASLLARDLMDFSMSGSFASIRFLTQVVPFFNARLQGLYKLGRAAKEDPKRFSQVLGTVALISLGLLAAYGDDDDWKKREEWDRNNYWWFKFGGTAIRIPKPFEIGAIATLAERSAEYLMDDEMNGKRFRAQLLALLGDNLAMNPIPQAVKPMLDVYANKDSFSGRPIETMGMDRLKSEYRVRGDTSMAARGISSAANSVTGLVGKEALSPVQIDHLIRGYFGWLGMFVVSASDIVARPATGQTDRPAPDYWKRATGGMVADLSDAPSRYVSQVYEQAKEIEQAYGTWRDLQKQGRREEADEFRRENTAAVQSYKAVERAKARMSHLNAEVSRIEKSEMGADEKRLAIRPIRAEQEIIAKRVPVLN